MSATNPTPAEFPDAANAADAGNSGDRHGADSTGPAPGSPNFARRAAQVLRRAGKVVWRSEPEKPAEQKHAASFAELTERLKGYLPSAEIQRIREAYRFSDAAHLGQFRKSGEPYITHPIAVAGTLAEWRLDSAAIQAALLHDVMEDSGVRKPQLAEKFGPIVAELVDGVSKLDRLSFDSGIQAQAESFRKMLLAMARDVRVILIKLADRLHNVRTLGAVDPEKRRRIARETMEIYAPIAHRLGLNEIYLELQDRSLMNLYPMRYRVLKKAVNTARGSRRELLGRIHDAVQKQLAAARLKAELSGREKTMYGIYHKMVEKRLSFSDVLDIYGFRVIVNTVPDCYLALGALHGLYKPVPGKFKDYIAIPKVNGYQSLHTTLIGPYGTPVEFQIRTQDMNRVAESGVAAHWLYKEDDASLSELQARTHQWLQSLIEIQKQTGDSKEFLENIKVDLFPEKVYVFTPRGKIVSLPRRATPVDFAYAIHTDIGNKCVAARVNGEIQPLRTELRNGDVVEIVAGPVARPNPTWLGFVRTGKARAEIRHFLRTMKRQESVDLGGRLFSQAAAQLPLSMQDISPERWDELAREAHARDRDELLADIGLGRRLAAVVARQMNLLLARHAAASGAPAAAATGAAAASGASGASGAGASPASPAAAADEASAPGPARPEPARAAPVIIHGTEGMALQMANCCNPIPGDAIVGHMRRDLGLLVHQSECRHAQRARRADPERWIDLEWGDELTGIYDVNLIVRVVNERGVLGRAAAAIAEAESNILNVNIEDEGANVATIHFKLQVQDRRHLARVVRSLRRIKHVGRVTRVKAGRTLTTEEPVRHDVG